MEMEVIKFIGAGLTTLGMLGAALGVGQVASAFLNGVARNPSAEPKMKTMFFIGMALAEFMGLLSFVVAMMILQ